MKDYDLSLNEFVKKHKIVKIITSELENDSYHKEYIGEDNSVFFEKISPDYVKQEIEVKGIKVEVVVKLLKVEYWSTDDSKSKYYYEQY